jgi:hypothetical protein
MASTLPETKERSLARFNQKWRADGECWTWTGALTNGYGSFRINGRSYSAHQAAFVLLKGDLPSCIDHLCRNRACVNPAHLEAVSNRENVLRGVGVTAINAKKTHCPKGHELTADNTLIKTSNRHDYRACRTCYNEYERGRKTRAAAKRRMNMLTETERKRQDELAQLKAQLKAAERERDSLRAENAALKAGKETKMDYDIEAISAAVHEAWMENKRKAGVSSRKLESGEELMVPYAQLSEQAKELDRGSVRAVVAAIEQVSRG